MAQSVGSIYYTVEADTADLVNSANDVDAALTKNQRSMAKADTSADKLGTRMTKVASSVKQANKELTAQSSAYSGLTKVVAAYLSLRTLQSVIAMSDQYGQMASRIRNATSSVEEYEKVQARLLETADGTYRALSEAQEVYLATADTLRDLGYTTDDVLDITDSFSYALVRDAARADQATTAMDAYSKALMKGKVEADGWASIMAATPSIVNGIAEATGRSAEEIRKLGATGKLSVDALNEGLRRSRDENKAMADEMETSVADAFTKLRNSMVVFVGKVNESSGASSILTENVSELAGVLKDPQTIRAAQDMAAGVVSALTGIINAMKETVGFVQWGAESIAAAFNGINADDVVRLTQELDKLQKLRAGGMADRIRFFGKGGVVEYWDDAELDAEIAKIQAALKEAAKNTPPLIPPPTTGSGTGTGTKPPAGNVPAEVVDTQAAEKASKKRTAAAEKLAKKEADAAAKAKAKEEADAAKKAKDQQALLGQLDPIAGEQQKYETELANLKALNEAKLLEDQRYLELKTQAEQAHAETMKQLEEERFRQMSAGNELLMASLDQLQSAATNTITGIVTGATDGKEAMQALAGSILNEAVGALVQMGIEQAKNFVMGQTQQAAAATTAAGTGAAMAASYAPAAAAASVASFGSAAGAGLAAMAAAIPAMIGLVAGGRQYGGPVAAGKMYRVNENGAPEIYNAANGQQYMIPNSRGEVISNANSSGGAAVSVEVNVQNYSGQKVDVQRSQGLDRQEVINIVVGDMQSGGPTGRTVNQITGTRRAGY